MRGGRGMRGEGVRGMRGEGVRAGESMKSRRVQSGGHKVGGCKRGIATRMSQRRTPPTSTDERTTSAYQRSTYTNPTALFRATSRFQIASNIYSNIMCSHILHSISCRGRPLSFHSLAHSNPHEESFSKKAWNPEKYLLTKFPRLFPRRCRALRPSLVAFTCVYIGCKALKCEINRFMCSLWASGFVGWKVAWMVREGRCEDM